MGLKDKLKSAINSINIDDDDINGLIQNGLKEIKLKNDIELTETININVDNITIDGDGHSIDADGKQALNITSNNITLKNITFKNAHSSNPGGAIFNLKGLVKIIDCSFISNHTDSNNGGAIYNESGKVFIDSSDFIHNSARFGGAIYNKGTLKMTFANFSDNVSSKGLSIFNTSDLILETCNFKRKDDTKNFEIYNRGIISIESFQKEVIQKITEGGFVHIHSKDTKPFRYLNDLIKSGKKEIILNYDICFDDEEKIRIDEDDVKIDGAGHRIDGMGKSNILEITGNNVHLSNINFRNGSGPSGGSIINKGESLKLLNCTFDWNISNNGGAIRNDASIDIQDCNFEKNIANKDSGGAIENNGDLTATDCKFMENYAMKNGGAINNNGNINLSNSCFKSNIAENGASIENNEKSMLLKCNFEENKAFNQGSIIHNAGCLTMRNCESFNNISNRYSNIIFQNDDENCTLNIEECMFARDRFNNNLIFIENGSSIIKSTKFIVNKEHENSYIIYNENATVEIGKLEFENVDQKTVYNDNFLEIEKDMEEYIESGKNGKPLKYKSN